MTHDKAKVVAAIYGGVPVEAGPDTWVTFLLRPDKSIVLFTDRMIKEYESVEAFRAYQPNSSIALDEICESALSPENN